MHQNQLPTLFFSFRLYFSEEDFISQLPTLFCGYTSARPPTATVSTGASVKVVIGIGGHIENGIDVKHSIGISGLFDRNIH